MKECVLGCMSLEWAHHVSLPRQINSGAIGGIADIARSRAARPPDANDPTADIATFVTRGELRLGERASGYSPRTSYE
jgi:hypothetical protein